MVSVRSMQLQCWNKDVNGHLAEPIANADTPERDLIREYMKEVV